MNPQIGPIRKSAIRSSFRTSLKLRGATNKKAIDKIVGLLDKLTEEDFETFLLDIAEEIRESTVDYIEKQNPVWPPLSPAYAAYKERHPLFDSRMLIATGHYIDSIRVKVNRDRHSNTSSVSVGVPPLKKHETLDRDGNIIVQELRLGELAAIHEYGSETKKIPARPVWGPMRNVWKTRMREEMLPRFGKAFGYKFRRKVNRVISATSPQVKKL